MTNEMIYAEIVAMLREYEAETGRSDGSLEKILADNRKLEELSYFTACPNIYASAARVILDLRNKMDKKANSAGRVNVCRRMDKGSLRAELAGIHEQGGRYCITDGYRAFRFSADLPSIRRAQVPFDFEKVIPAFGFSCETLPPVSRAEIKEFIAVTGQTRSKPKGAFSPAKWPQWYAVNPFYLLDVLDAIPDAVFFMPESYCKPLYFADGAGNDGILLPVRSKKAVEEWNKYQEEKKSMERRSA